MAESAKIAELVNRVPEPDEGKGVDGKLTGPRWDKAAEVLDAILADGADGVAAVIAMLKPAESKDDYKARYVLYSLCVYAGRPDKREARDMVVAALRTMGLRRIRPADTRASVVSRPLRRSALM